MRSHLRRGASGRVGCLSGVVVLLGLLVAGPAAAAEGGPPAHPSPMHPSLAHTAAEQAPRTTGPSTRVRAAAASAAIVGGGSSFVGRELDAWRSAVASAQYGNLAVTYQSSGSSFGRSAFSQGQLDFGISDIEYQSPGEDREAGARAFRYIPLSAGGVAFLYQLHDSSGNQVTNLRLSPTTACGIFTGQITDWSDPAIAADQSGGRGLKPQPIDLVVRGDGSGQSFVLAEWCIALQPTLWANFVSQHNDAFSHSHASAPLSDKVPFSDWPTDGYTKNPRSAIGTDGVSQLVGDTQNGDGAITYAETGFGDLYHVPVAQVQNLAGQYTSPGATAVNTALAYATQDTNGTHHLKFDTTDPSAYNPSTYSYLLAPTTGFDASKGSSLAQFIDYAVTTGQNAAVPLGYAPLGPCLVAFSLDAALQVPGAPPRPGGAPTLDNCVQAARQQNIQAGAVNAGSTQTGGGPVGGSGPAAPAAVTPAGPAPSTQSGGTASSGGAAASASGSSSAGPSGASGGPAGSTGAAAPGGSASGSSVGGSTAVGSTPGSGASGPVPGGSSSRTPSATKSSSGTLGVDPSVSLDPAIGPLAHTGAEQQSVITASGVGLVLLGEAVRRRSRRRFAR